MAEVTKTAEHTIAGLQEELVHLTLRAAELQGNLKAAFATIEDLTKKLEGGSLDAGQGNATVQENSVNDRTAN